MNYVGSSAWIIEQNKNPHGTARRFKYADKVDMTKPAMVVLGGALTTNETKAFGYIEHLLNIINNKSNVNICAAVYNFGTVDPMLIKANVFRRAGRKMALDMDTNVALRKEQELAEINKNEPTPGYIEDLYETVIEPRIVRGNVAATIKNMRNLVIYSHCHGAVVVNQMANMATSQMKTSGFSSDDIKRCLSNIIVIQHNPTAPLEDAKFTTLNFMSASDDTLDYFDAFSKKILRHDDMQPAYMGDDYANVFVAGKLNKTNGSEHGFSLGYKGDNSILTENGKIIFGAEQNAINNALNAALSAAPMPTVEQLVAGPGIDIAKMRATGQQMMQGFSH